MPTYTDPPTAADANPIERVLSRIRTKSADLPTPEEVEGFRLAQKLSFSCAQAVAAEMRPGWTEGQTQDWMTSYLHDHGVRTSLHKPIVGFGPRSLAPDAEWFPAKGAGLTLEDNDVAIIDCAPIVNGYAGDVAYTIQVGDVPELTEAMDFLSDLRNRIPGQFTLPETAATIFEWVTGEMEGAGYQNAVNGYHGHILGHRVYRHRPASANFRHYLPTVPFGYKASWHSPGFLLKSIRRALMPELLGPFHTGPKTGVWAIEPHLRVGTKYGVKFEELLVVEDGYAYWLDDTSQKRIVITAGN
ncbi:MULTISPECIES: M24 family metallopeptidase [Rhodococcus]|uniref:M24 family metallopeptidase n=1 Tax=Rhodococcus oxybenzonivorans TaxID=1990687 RepID=A0AAE4V300_9NOCA|nr:MULTISPECIES: M24 family metallopeptidase [Rhodococcus]MDV7245797.1 M24 family metallopeptidase [Rhodococcus oxybenzonivorans]MDV7267986.1 M24 family metallopeptidase [Rhodococcus oxybenzonivorans]MDV7277399.1 M24 family metallopeptidase [Rhodococcus oxybenzonivorans]MDV7336969.1 M24 family metallopeptidase [Rhodococcus oxybenzonivorans]MDV7347111.1 M24 family metallopeptidase [Rhodococcus oxybenzonivorans]